MGSGSETESTREEERHEQGLLEVDRIVHPRGQLVSSLSLHHREMLDCFQRLSEDSSCRVILLTAEGKTFSAGHTTSHTVLSRSLGLVMILVLKHVTCPFMPLPH